MILLNIFHHRDLFSQLYSNLWDSLGIPDDVGIPESDFLSDRPEDFVD